MEDRWGKYRLLSEIGQGTYGIVYRALDTELGREVALKVLHPKWQGDPGFVEHFRGEARTAAGLQHPNIVKVHAMGEIEGRSYIDMELVEGQPLDRILKSEKQLSPERVCTIVQDVGAALDHAHEHGLLHRDVKPSNIIVDAAGRAHLTDFGLARPLAMGSSMSAESWAGTPAYMAPELCQGVAADRRSDLYSLAAVAYEMLTGQVPYPGRTAPEVFARIGSGEAVAPPRALNPRLKVDTARVILRALDRVPDKRFKSGIELASALAQSLQETPPPPPKVTEVAPRKRAGLGLWLAGAAVLVLVLGGFSIAKLLRSRDDGPTPTALASGVALRPTEMRASPSPLADTPAVPRTSPAPTDVPTSVPVLPANYVVPASTLLEGSIAEDTVLAPRAGAYIVRGALQVNEGVTLQVQPGAIVKFQDEAHLVVLGSLHAQGTAEQPIVFTSIKDDSFGGDSNNDGGSSAPAPGDWTYIGFFDNSNDANCIVEHALIRFSGENGGRLFGAIQMEGASPTVSDTTIEQSAWYALSADVHSFPRLARNTLAENGGNGMEIRGGTQSVVGAWENTDVVYVVTGSVVVAENATLRLLPGVVVKLSPGTYFDVRGTFRSEGAEGQPVTLTSLRDDTAGGDTNGDGTSSVPAPGDWNMVFFRDTSNDKNSTLANSLIRYAGRHDGRPIGAVYLESASPSVVTSVLSDNAWYAVSGDPNSFPALSGNAMERNGGNGLEIRQGTLSQSGAWKNVDTAYSVTGPVTIQENATLSLVPAVVVKLGTNAYFDVYGTLRVAGTADQPVTFTSAKDDTLLGDTNGDGESSTPGPGDWTMIRFRDSSNDANSIVDGAIVRFAGLYGGDRHGALHLEGASPTVTRSTFTDNAWYAVSGDVASFPAMSGNTLERNGGNGLEVRSGELRISGAWSNTDVVYAVTGRLTIAEGTTLSVKAGAMVKFGDNCFVDVYGTFAASGTADSPVTFTSIKDDATGGDTNGDSGSSVPSAGDWTMIRFYDSSNDASSVIKGAILEYAGEHDGNRYGAIHLESASPTVTDCTFRDNWGYAVSASVNSFPKVGANTLERNAGNGLEIRAGELDVIGAWSNTGIVYVVNGALTVRNNATLTIDAGVTVKFTENSHINVRGSFRSMGSAGAAVVMTSLRDDTAGGDTNGDGTSSSPAPGDWTMIRFYDESNDANCRMENTLIRYAGRYGGDRYGAVHILSASPALANCTIADSFYYGIWYDAGSSPSLSGNTYSNNAEGDVHAPEAPKPE